MRTATLGRARRFGDAVELTHDGLPGDVVVSAAGATMATWTEQMETTSRLVAAFRPRGATAFGAPEDVSPAERVFDTRAALSSAGRPMMAWLTSAIGATPPFNARVSLRAG